MFNNIIIFITLIIGIFLIYKVADTIYKIAMEKLNKINYHVIDLTLGGGEDELFRLMKSFKYLAIDEKPIVEVTANIGDPNKIERYAIGRTDRVDIINSNIMRVFIKPSDNIGAMNGLIDNISTLNSHIIGVSLANDKEPNMKKHNILVIVVDDRLPDDFKNILGILNKGVKR